MSHKVSVVMACYNHGSVIQRAIDSVRAQTVPAHEIIVVNDGSTEPATIQALHDLETTEVVVLHKENGGPSSARNLGVSRAVGEFILPLDADDGIEPTYIEKTLAKFKDDTGIVGTGVQVHIKQNGVWIPTSVILPKLLAVSDIFSASMFRRECWEKVGGYDEELPGMEDHDFWIRILAAGWKVEIVEEFLTHYYRSPTGLCDQVVHGNTELYRTLLAKHAELYQQHWQEIMVAMHQKLEGQYSVADELLNHITRLEGELQRAQFVLHWKWWRRNLKPLWTFIHARKRRFLYWISGGRFDRLTTMASGTSRKSSPEPRPTTADRPPLPSHDAT